MTQEEFDKATILEQILYDETGMLLENHKWIKDVVEKYHQAKVKENELLHSVSVSDSEIEKESQQRYGEVTGGSYHADRPYNRKCFRKGAEWMRDKLTSHSR